MYRRNTDLFFYFILLCSVSEILSQFLTAKPDIFITSNDTEPEYEPFQLIYDGSRFFKLSEYVLVGVDDISKFHIVYLDTSSIMELTSALIVDDIRKATIRQNLQKELFFAHYNSSGVFPQMMISNTTTTKVYTFKANDTYGISYFVNYQKEHETLEITPPYDLLVEVPGYSHSITTKRTLIDVQSFTFLRFQMSADDLVTYEEILDHAEALFPTYLHSKLTWNMLESSIKIISNPCIQDFFLLYMMVGLEADVTKVHGPRPIYTYIQIPAYYTPGNDACWHNVTSIYCPHLDYEQECGEPEDLLLTNRHLLVLSSKGLFVSNDLTGSTYKLSDRYTSAPLARYDIVNPCRGIFECFQTLSNPSDEFLLFKRTLAYVPFCDTQQYPNNDDIVIFIMEHTDQSVYRHRPDYAKGTGPIKTYSVTFAARPYIKWKPLFVKQEMFEDRYIEEITGIFFNNQVEKFDITMKLSPPIDTSNRDDAHGKYVRFILPLPSQEPYISEGYPYLNGTWGKETGFIVQNFSETFQMNGITVNPGTMDVIFYGSQIHIAESSRPIVYEAVGGFEDTTNTVTGCHFNHPDRFYVCMLKKKSSILIGRVATGYGPMEVDLLGLEQIQRLIDSIFAMEKRVGMKDNKVELLTQGQKDILEYIFERAIFTASFSGKIYMWYFSDPDYFYSKIQEHDAECAKDKKCNVHLLPKRPTAIPKPNSTEESKCGYQSCYRTPCILPLLLDPLEFKVKNKPTHGPLVPLFMHADTVLLYEAFVPGGSTDFMHYLTPVFIGQKIFCAPEKGHIHKDDEPPSSHYGCELYFRHIKMLINKDQPESGSILPGFRSAIYATVAKPIPMGAIQDNLRIQMSQNTNRVRILCTDDKFTAVIACKDISVDDISGSIYIPGEYSVLILGEDWQIKNSFKGLATHKTVLPFEIKVPAFESFKINLRTDSFVRGLIRTNDQSQHFPPNTTYSCDKDPPAKCITTNPGTKLDPKISIMDWEIGDGGCQFEMTLQPNSYVKSSGGKIDLDLHDSVSFSVIIRPTAGMGKKMLYRPLMVVTQSNEEVLHISSGLQRLPDRQVLSVLLKPTGVRQGVSSFVIRSVVSSISCSSPSSLTFIIQCVRSPGRRLLVEYPNSASKEDLLAPGKAIMLSHNTELYKVLPVNYRPPSRRGGKITLTKNVYNADPSKPLYNSWYRLSKQSAYYKSCLLQSSRENCRCKDDDKLSDDPIHSDCKEKVYVVRRDEETHISLTYPPRMPDSEQIPEFFSTAPQITVTVTEINGRVDYAIQSDPKDQSLLDDINEDEVLSMGTKYYSASNLTFKLLGTGLYHFKATLGRFHTFNDVSAYIVLYSDTNEIDDVMLVMIVISTLTICFVLVFFGFIRVRHSLVLHLPVRVQQMTKEKTA